MGYQLNLLLSALCLSFLPGEVQLVSGVRIPSRDSSGARRQDAVVEIPGLNVLSQYVCPRDADHMTRQNSGSGTITVPKDQLREFLLSLRVIESQMVDLIDMMLLEDGFDPDGSTNEVASSNTMAIEAVPVPTVAPPATLSSAVDLTLVDSTAAVSASACTYNISTTTIQLTMTKTAAVVTVTATYTNGTTPFVAANSTTGLEARNSTTMTGVATFSTSATTILTGSAANTNGLSTSARVVFLETSTGGAAATSLTEEASLPAITGTLRTSEELTSGYVFNAQSSKNVAVYFGQTPVTDTTTLEAQCADPNIDIVILAFVMSQLDGGPYPSVNFGAACGGQTAKMAAQAPGLLSCPQLASYIQACQKTYGKKVLLSIGGATSQISFSSAAQASDFGDVLWNLFGPPGKVDIQLRPFGTVSIDGFDIGV